MRKMLALLALIALAVTPALADRSLDGSNVTTDPASVNAGTTGVAMTLFIYNGSVDVEWIASGFVTLPSDLTFLTVDGYNNPSGNPIDFAIAGGTLNFSDPDGGWGQIYDGDTCEVYVTIDVPADADCGMNVITYGLQGDIYGSDPHYVEGATDFEIVCTTGAQTTDWSAIKALY